MKNKLIKPASLMCSLLFLSVFPSIGATDEYYYFESDSYPTITADKFLGGATNVGTSLLEIPKSIINTHNESNFALAITGGLLKGFVNFFGRTMVGLIDVLTFPIPTKPVPQPGVIWDDFDSETSYEKSFRLRD